MTFNRRQMFKSLLSAPLAVAGMTIVETGSEIVLRPGAVGTGDFRVYDLGDGIGRVCAMTLFEKPWPIVGDRVRLEFEDLRIVAVVAQTDMEPVGHLNDRFLYHINARVVEFDGRAVR